MKETFSVIPNGQQLASKFGFPSNFEPHTCIKLSDIKVTHGMHLKGQ